MHALDSLDVGHILQVSQKQYELLLVSPQRCCVCCEVLHSQLSTACLHCDVLVPAGTMTVLYLCLQAC